jgi:hypothetical protein
VRQVYCLPDATLRLPGRVSVGRCQTGRVRLIEQILRFAVVVSIN